jgi:hypothetical protein
MTQREKTAVLALTDEKAHPWLPTFQGAQAVPVRLMPDDQLNDDRATAWCRSEPARRVGKENSPG